MCSRKLICMVLTCILALGFISVPVKAAEESVGVIQPFASSSFHFSIPGKSQMNADTPFLLAEGETIKIDATYTPTSADVEVILFMPDGTIRQFSGVDGDIYKTIRVSENGSYTLGFRNNSDVEVVLDGEVYY